MKNILIICISLLLVTQTNNLKATDKDEVTITKDSATLARTATNAAPIPLGTPEYPGLCPYRGHIGKYQCINVSPTKHGDIQRTACKGKNLYLSKGNCYKCPAGYKRSWAIKKMTNSKACVKHQKGKNPKSAGIYVRKSYLGCPSGQFKYKGGCHSCPAKTKRKHLIGIDSGKCKVEKEYRCNAGLELHKSAPENIWNSLSNWVGLKHKKYCGQPFDLNTYALEVAASETNKLLIEAIVRFGVKIAKDDEETKQKVAEFRTAIEEKRLNDAYTVLKSFDEFALLESAALEAQQFAISIGVGYDKSFGIGFNSELGLAIDVGQRKLVQYRSHGLTKGVSFGADAGINVGVWAGAFETSYAQGYIAAVAEAGIGVWSDYYTPKREDGLNQPHFIGLTSSFGAGVSVELGEYNETWTKVGELLDCDIETGFRLDCS